MNIFNAALVTPTYYVFFTSATIITSAILFQGFKGTAVSITTIVMGFLQICSGVVLLQLSKSAKDVPDAAVFTGDLNQVRQVGEQEQPESEPKADAIRGTSAIVRRISASRQKMEQEEARRYFEDRRQDDIEPLTEDQVVEWDGLRRRKTTLGSERSRSRTTLHPPLGMSRFPDESEMEPERRPTTRESGGTHSFLGDIRSRASSVLHPSQWRSGPSTRSPVHPVAMSEIAIPPPHEEDEFDDKQNYASGGLQKSFHPGGRERSDTPRSIAWVDDIGSKTDISEKSPVRPSYLHQESRLTPPEPPPHSGGSGRRQFSFQNVFNRGRSTSSISRPGTGSASGGGFLSGRGLGSRQGDTSEQRRAMKDASEEERLGLVEGDSEVLDADGNRRQRRSSSSSSSTTAFPDYHDSMKPGSHRTPGSSRGRRGKDEEVFNEKRPVYSSRRTSPDDKKHPVSSSRRTSPDDTKEVEDGWQELPRPNKNQPTPPKKLPPIPYVEEPENEPNLRPAPLDISSNYTHVELRTPDPDTEDQMQGDMERRRQQQELQQRQRRLRRKRRSQSGSPSKDAGGGSSGEEKRGPGGGSFI